MATLDEVAQVVGGGTPSRAEPAYWNGRIPWATPTDLTKLPGRYILKTASSISEKGLTASSARLLPPGSVLMTSRATIGVCAINTTPMATNQGFQNLVPREGTDAEYLFYALSNKQAELIKLAAGSTFLEVSRRSVAHLAVVLPPLPEQRKIAAILSSVDEAVGATQAVIDQLHSVRNALLAELLARGMPGRHRKFKETDLGSLPATWAVIPLHQVVHPDTTITYGIVQAGPNVADGVPYIRTGDVRPEGISAGVLARTAPEIAARFERSRVRAGELVFCIRASIGAVAMVPPELDGANLTQGTARISPGPSVGGEFLLWALRSPAVQNWIGARSKGSTFREITLGALRQTPVPVPPLDEQEVIVRTLSSLEERLRTEKMSIARLTHIKRGLSHALLTGTQRVAKSWETA